MVPKSVVAAVSIRRCRQHASETLTHVDEGPAALLSTWGGVIRDSPPGPKVLAPPSHAHGQTDDVPRHGAERVGGERRQEGVLWPVCRRPLQEAGTFG